MSAATKSSHDSVFTGLMNFKFVQSDMTAMPALCHRITADYFDIRTTADRRASVKVYCELWHDVILLRESPETIPVGFMDVGFSRLKLVISKNEKKLILVQNMRYEELWSENEKLLVSWYQALANCCIYSNFRCDFNIQELLGKGNFANVFLVEDKFTLKKFAAKIFDKQLINSDEFEKVVVY